eukprot:jgi/Bigna1/91433/estExt_fgenesh1_pg.C_1000054
MQERLPREGDELRSPLLQGGDDREGFDGEDSAKDVKKILVKVISPGNPLLQFQMSPTATVSKVKDLIESKRPNYPKARQRLIYCGRELPHSKILSSEPNPIIDGATIHLALRPEARIESLHMNEDPDTNQNDGGHAGAGVDNEIPPALELVAQEIMFVEITMNRSSRWTRAIGVGFITLSSLFLLRGSAGPASWTIVLAGGLLFLLGLLGVYAGRNRSTCIAGAYYYGLWSYMIVLTSILTLGYVDDTDDGDQTSYIAYMLLLIMLPFFLCSPCAYCARVHYRNCLRRDSLHREFALVGLGI